ncbi:hypothetical protein GBAR_LOCUS11821, partial [Geodia barretti]
MACSPATPETITETVEVTKIVEVPGEQVQVTVEVPGEQVQVTRIVQVMAPEGPKDTIIFGDLNWSSALLQNRIAQYIVEKGYGYPTD